MADQTPIHSPSLPQAASVIGKALAEDIEDVLRFLRELGYKMDILSVGLKDPRPNTKGVALLLDEAWDSVRDACEGYKTLPEQVRGLTAIVEAVSAGQGVPHE